MQVIKCNKCGKEIVGLEQKFSINKSIPYGSEYDGEHLRCDLCCECLDSILDGWSKTFTYNPFVSF